MPVEVVEVREAGLVVNWEVEATEEAGSEVEATAGATVAALEASTVAYRGIDTGTVQLGYPQGYS